MNKVIKYVILVTSIFVCTFVFFTAHIIADRQYVVSANENAVNQFDENISAYQNIALVKSGWSVIYVSINIIYAVIIIIIVALIVRSIRKDSKEFGIEKQ